LMSSKMFDSLCKLYSSLFHLGRQHPPHVLGHTFFAIFSFQTCLASALTFVLRSKLRSTLTLFIKILPSSPNDNYGSQRVNDMWFNRCNSSTDKMCGVCVCVCINPYPANRENMASS
jgi:hypothetical protein